jgi:hypothetical protein
MTEEVQTDRFPARPAPRPGASAAHSLTAGGGVPIIRYAIQEQKSCPARWEKTICVVRLPVCPQTRCPYQL